MKIGIYGGSFNPIHFGHTGLAQWTLAHTDLDEVWLMVSPANPLKDEKVLADEQQRLAQVREAVKEMKGIRVSDFEFGLPRPSYTANTMRALTERYPEHTFSLIIGEDNLALFARWRESAYLANNFRIFVYPRHGSGEVPTPEEGHFVRLKEAPYFDISSTELRKSML